MSKIRCCPGNMIPIEIDPEFSYISLYSPLQKHGVGHVGLNLPREIRRDQISPSIQAWDFTTIASSIVAADQIILREKSSDGWTRMIDLEVSVVDPNTWNNVSSKLESVLHFLTGDFWALHFSASRQNYSFSGRQNNRDVDCVCLLSGGVDSLIGAIDLSCDQRKPLFVSQIVRGSKKAQKQFASELGMENNHLQWSLSVNSGGKKENSTRARSIIFFAFAALAASSLNSSKNQFIDVFVPENGFISLNIPLTIGRLGSLSTKTTHPIYTSGIQEIWDYVGIPGKLKFPYKFTTKGEMIRNCQNTALLQNLIGSSVSCGKYQRHNLTHCGICIPCLIRRAAFQRAEIEDSTEKGYVNQNLIYSESKDVAAAALAYVKYKREGIRKLTGGSLSFLTLADRKKYEDVLERGMEELGQFLQSQKII